MIAALVAVAVTSACAFASGTRLAFAVAPTALDVGVLLRAVRSDDVTVAVLQRAVAALPQDAWEQSLMVALRAPPPQRAALFNESLAELDALLQRWIRVPRVCASVSSTSCLMLASLALRAGLTATGDIGDAAFGSYLNATVLGAVNVAAVGVAGAAFCVAVQYRARRAAKGHLDAADKLVARFEALASQGAFRST